MILTYEYFTQNTRNFTRSLFVYLERCANQKKNCVVLLATFYEMFVCTNNAAEELGQTNRKRYHPAIQPACIEVTRCQNREFRNDDKYLNGSSYLLCAANNHSKSIMTVIKTASKHQFSFVYVGLNSSQLRIITKQM